MEFLKKFKTTSLYNNTHFFVISPILIGLSFKYIIFVIPLTIYLLYIIKKRIFIKPILIITFLFLGLFYISINYETKIDDSFEGIVIDKEENKYTLLSKLECVIVYSESSYKVGDKLYIIGTKSHISEESYEGGFSYKEYLQTKRIYNIFRYPEITYKGHINTLSSFKYKIINFYSKKVSSTTLNYILTLTLGYNNLNDIESENIKNIGISHLFAVSGFHVNLIFIALYFLLSKIIKSEFLKENIIIFFFCFYIIFTGFNISILRSAIMIILTIYFKRYNKLYTSLDILSMALLICLLVNPLYFYQIGFCLTFLITFFLIISINITKSNNKIKSTMKTTLIAFFSSLPVIINLNGSVNLLTIIFTPIFTIVVGYILLPLSFFIYIIPILSKLKIFEAFDKMLNMLSSIEIFNLRFSYINIYFIIFYYIIFIFILIMLESKKINKKIIALFSFYLIFLLNIKNLDFNYHITMIDVSQGDSMLIRCPNNKGNILIDSFGYNVSYLKHLGISKIDYLIITHSDDDHMRTAQEVIERFDVEEVYINYFDKVPFDARKLISGNSLYLNDIKIDVLAPIFDTNDINNNSLVMKIDILGYKLLTTGDIESLSERILVDKYRNHLKSDILKVAHHGSDTSSTLDFINYVNPDISLISVGVDNKYGFPSNKVLNNLKKSDIYRTDINGNIDIKINKSGIKVNTYR